MAERARTEGQGKPVELKTLINRFRENEQELKESRTAGSSNTTSPGGQRSATRSAQFARGCTRSTQRPSGKTTRTI